MSERLPTLRRDIDIIPVEHEGQRLFLIQDHLGLVSGGVAIPQAYAGLFSLFGTGTVRDLQQELMRHKNGSIVSSDEVTQFIDELDRSLLLESETYFRAKNKLVTEFSRKRTRPSVQAGRSYPADEQELHTWLSSIVPSPSAAPFDRIQGLVAPHIDPGCGAAVYAEAYGALKNSVDLPETVIILGIGHQLSDGIFCITDKDFETPLGRVENRRDISGRLLQCAPHIISRSDFAHRDEHSIEFQVLFLQHVLPKGSFSIVPILCGSLFAAISPPGRKPFQEYARPILESLQSILAEDSRVLVVAGVDFSHIGPKFGHRSSAHAMEQEAEQHDRALLDHLAVLDGENFWQESLRVQDRYNVCGFSAMATLLEILPGCRGRILDYRISHEHPTRSAVAYAAAVFTS
ncbi:MAG: AmmeMemoRadiSam system protein B [Desulfovibrionales bacterium]